MRCVASSESVRADAQRSRTSAGNEDLKFDKTLSADGSCRGGMGGGVAVKFSTGSGFCSCRNFFRPSALLSMSDKICEDIAVRSMGEQVSKIEAWTFESPHCTCMMDQIGA